MKTRSNLPVVGYSPVGVRCVKKCPKNPSGEKFHIRFGRKSLPQHNCTVHAHIRLLGKSYTSEISYSVTDATEVGMKI